MNVVIASASICGRPEHDKEVLTFGLFYINNLTSDPRTFLHCMKSAHLVHNYKLFECPRCSACLAWKSPSGEWKVIQDEKNKKAKLDNLVKDIEQDDKKEEIREEGEKEQDDTEQDTKEKEDDKEEKQVECNIYQNENTLLDGRDFSRCISEK